MNSLKAYAVDDKASRGRKHPEEGNDERDAFQLDRDRVLHCRAWRRMDGKTQVFVLRDDHYRNRMTHSLEVSQIARDLARSLGLNEDLAETIALAHDLGHTPFGHAGESALHDCLKEYDMHFEHNEQSRRVVEELERVYPNFPGLNLSIEVIEGLMKHHTSWDNPLGGDPVRPSLEAQVVNLADEIAYQNHDVDDGLRSGLFKEEDLMDLELWKQAKAAVEEEYGPIEDTRARRARTVSKMIGIMIRDVHERTQKELSTGGIETLADVYAHEGQIVDFSKEMKLANKALKDFLISRLYMHPQVFDLCNHGQKVIQSLFAYYMEKTDGAPYEDKDGVIQVTSSKEAAARTRDYIAGMTDGFAIKQAKELGLLS
jgi:dGTPase